MDLIENDYLIISLHMPVMTISNLLLLMVNQSEEGAYRVRILHLKLERFRTDSLQRIKLFLETASSWQPLFDLLLFKYLTFLPTALCDKVLNQS